MLGDYEVHYLMTKQTADVFTEGLAAGYAHKMTEDEFMRCELDTIATDIAKCIDCIAETSNTTLPLPIPKDNKRWYTINDLVYKAYCKTWKMYEKNMHCM